jgi:acetate kinase
MIILVLNCGSSSVKYSLFYMGHEEKRLIRGSIDRAGLDRAGLANAESARVHHGLMGEYQADVRDYSHAVSYGKPLLSQKN